MQSTVLEVLEKRADDLATLPGPAVRIMELCSDPDVRIGTLATALEGDPVIASRILRLANSAYYGRFAGVSSLREAVMVLGLEAVRALGLSIGVLGHFIAGDGVKRPEIEGLWHHSIGVALTAREIARRIGVKERERAFVAGLIHDIGQFVLIQYLPERYQALLAAAPGHSGSFQRAERDALETDHAEVGAWLTRKWSLPEELRQAIALHHAAVIPEGPEPGLVLSRIVQVADWMVSSQGIAPTWYGGRASPVPQSRQAIALDEDSLLQLCLGLDRRVSQIGSALGLRPISPDVFQRALHRANRALAQLAVDLDFRGRRLRQSLSALTLLQRVTAALVGVHDAKAIIGAFLTELAHCELLEYVQCVVPASEGHYYVGALDRTDATATAPRVRLITAAEWERLEQKRNGFPAVARQAIWLGEGPQGELVARLATDADGEMAELDLAPLAGVLAVALCRSAPGAAPAAAQTAPAAACGSGNGLNRAVEDDALRVLGEMAAGAAHDINNSLAVVLGQAQLGLIAESIPEMRQYFDTIERTSKDCAGIVRRLQEFSRGARKPRSQALVDLAAVARETIEITRPRWKDEAQRRGIYIKTVIDLPEPLPVEGDAGALRQVLSNLVLNSLDAMNAGGVLTLKGRLDGDTVRLSVHDTGVGMTPEVMERLFEPFFTTKGEGGTGLGLSVSKRIVEEHEGELTVTSRPGVGSTFTVSLPRSVRDTVSDTKKPEPPGGAPLKVLLIDDEPQVREVLMRMLRLDGHTPTPAGTAREGLRLLASERFDLVLTDLGLPDMPGWQLARAAKRGSTPVPVVLITGWTEEGERPSSGDDVDAVLVKPFGIAELRQVMRTALEANARPVQ